jgi:hypothetical protein
MTSIEGTLIGDQGFYWTTPAEVWIFPHRLGNIDNRVMFQWADAPAPDPTEGFPPTLFNVNGLMQSTGLVSSIQTNKGGGFVVETIDRLNVGLWLSGYATSHGAFVKRGIAATGWDTYVGNGAGDLGDLEGIDISGAVLPDPPGQVLEAGRKVDLFASYWLPALNIETGLRLWWGSSGVGFLPDDSFGPIDIDVDSDTATGAPNTDPNVGSDDQLVTKESTYDISDLGFSLGAGWTGIPGLRADLGLDINLLGVSWEPNGLSNYVDIGGSAFAANLRSHFELTPEWTVGGFFRFGTASLGFQPKRQRDGGDLWPLYTPTAADDLGNLPTPDGSLPNQVDPNYNGTEQYPSKGIKYEESSSQVQLAALVHYTPISRVKLYSALGVRRRSFTAKTSIGSTWSSEISTSWMTLPFVHIGCEGKVFDWLDLFLGATKQWRGVTRTTKYSDNRIPNNDDAPGNAGTPVIAGSKNFTNKNRRVVETKTSVDNPLQTSVTSVMIGARIHYKALQLIAHMDPDWLREGPAVLSGESNAMFAWMALVYDWDYDHDEEMGNGTQKYAGPSPHEAAPAKERERQPAPERVEYEEFDS